MKSLNKYISESLLTGKYKMPSARIQPQSKNELIQMIQGQLAQVNPKPGQEVNFNWIDIRYVDDLGNLFENTKYIPVIDKWEIDHVKSFNDMFHGNKYITRSPLSVLQKKLPTPTRAVGCYERMFMGCTSLVEPPELPARELEVECYAGMFSGCTSLVHAPKLPATKLAYGCYRSMFYECQSLVEPPELPAEKLDNHCYKWMFKLCTSLVSTPKLPAKKLAPYCYTSMFEDCRSLKDVCNLPATQLATGCYAYMFSNCKSLKRAPQLPNLTANDAELYCLGMFIDSSIKSSSLAHKIYTSI